ncbi:MAG: hypothetical protein HXY50_09950 [Ignavibacteriaceae bacterium]|nr:hypothetical protein [Ignavibacteriaceae bacterium]
MDNNKKVQTIFSRKHFINVISSLFVWFSGVLFILKYFEEPVLKIIFYSVLFLLAIYTIEKTERFYSSILNQNILFFITLLIAASAIILYRLNYINYPPIAGFLILCLIIFYHFYSVKVTLIQLAVFTFSPVVYSELNEFTGFFALSVLTALSIYISDRFLQSIKLDWKFFLLALLFGVTLSAHLVIGFIYIVYLLYIFRNELAKGLVFAVIIIAVYSLITFLESYEYIGVQVSHAHLLSAVPVWIKFLLILITVYVGWMAADLQEVLFSSGVMLFLAFTFQLVFAINQIGWKVSEMNFSLLIIAIPFLVLSIKDYKVDRFLGKVLTELNNQDLLKTSQKL